MHNYFVGALTGRLSCVPRKPARQIAAMETYTAKHSTGVLKISRLHSRSIRSDFQNARPVPHKTCFGHRIAIFIS
jgi:hypothetical protein